MTRKHTYHEHHAAARKVMAPKEGQFDSSMFELAVQMVAYQRWLDNLELMSEQTQ